MINILSRISTIPSFINPASTRFYWILKRSNRNVITVNKVENCTLNFLQVKKIQIANNSEYIQYTLYINKDIHYERFIMIILFKIKT